MCLAAGANQPVDYNIAPRMRLRRDRAHNTGIFWAMLLAVANTYAVAYRMTHAGLPQRALTCDVPPQTAS